ncbi:MAG: hypothetical protein HY788_24460 [Deltaproteobacteria bacterium]|nr:hypothetical protein [Deltaproteobacteria bacterium]
MPTLSPLSASTPPSLKKWVKILRAGVCGCLFLLVSVPGPVLALSPYAFQGHVSRRVLSNYLARAITMSNMLDEMDLYLTEHIRMVTHLGAKFLGRTALIWGNEGVFPARVADLPAKAWQVHAADPEVLLEAGIFEFVSSDVELVPIPSWVFEWLGAPVQTRNFDYESMLFTCQSPVIDGYPENASVPDVSRTETQMWIFYQAASYIDAGIEALHLGQLEWMCGCDPGFVQLEYLATLIRTYAARHARRGLVLLNAHSHGIVREGKLLLDFCEYPLRVKEAAGSQTNEGVLEMGFLDSIYGLTKGGLTPGGWYVEHALYLVEFDHGYAGLTPGTCTKPECVWGYDEITWFARLGLEERNAFIEYAWRWVRSRDPYGFVEMPGMRDIQGLAGNNADWYYANSPSSHPYGFDQEETIRRIWRSRPPVSDPTAGLRVLLLQGF